MYDDVPIVPNLYEAPSNPQARDCYYNITLDKYYIYDGTQWLEASSLENQNIFELKYSEDWGETFTTEIYTDFDELCVKMNSSVMEQATDIYIVMPTPLAEIVPRTSDTSLNGVALLKLNSQVPKKQDVFTLKYSKDGGNTFVIEEYNDFYNLTDRINSATMQGVTDIEVSMTETEDSNLITYDEGEIVGKIYPKIIFNQKLVENLYTNGTQTFKSVFDGVLVHYKPYAEIQWRTRTSHNGDSFIDGQGIHAYFTITNTGSLPLYNIIVSSEFSGDEWHIERLPVGNSYEFDAAYFIAQANIDAGNLPWDFNYEAEYEDSNGDTQTISGSTIYNIHPIQYRVQTGSIDEIVTGPSALITKLRSVSGTSAYSDLQIDEIEWEEENS